MEKNPETQDVETVETQQSTVETAQLPVLSTEQVIESARAALKQHALSEKLADVLAELSAVATVPIEIGDQDAIKAVDTARKKAKAIRTSIERKRKELKRVGLDYGDAVDITAHDLSTPVEAHEKRFEAALADVAKREKEADEKKEREELEKFNARVDELRAVGAKFDGQFWQTGLAKISPERIRNGYDDANWSAIVIAKFKAEADRLVEEARIKEEQAENAKKLQEENEQLRKRLAELESKPTAPNVLEVDSSGAVVDAVAFNVAEAPAQSETHTQVELPAQVEPPTKVEVLDVDNKRRFVPPIFKPLPVVEGVEVVTAPQVSLPVSEATEATAPETPTASERNLQALLKGSTSNGATHYSAGYRKGIKFAKETVLAILADPNIKTRGEIKAAIEAI